MKKLFIQYGSVISIVSAIGLPVISFAANQVNNSNKDLKYIAGLIIEYVNIAIGLVIALAVITFIWNVYRYFFTEKEKTEAGKYVMYSVIGFFVILSFWGLVAILRNSLQLDDKKPTDFPGTGSSGTPSSLFNGAGDGNGPFGPEDYD